MRAVVAIGLGMFVALLLQAAPAMAHGGGTHEARSVQSPSPSAAASVVAATIAPGLCAAVDRHVAVAEVVDHEDKAAHSHNHDVGPGHNRADHSHPFGDDDFHQMTAHCSHDLPAQTDSAVLSTPTATRLALPWFDDRSSGITVPPPVPPPLG